jgi:hypothetical protein
MTNTRLDARLSGLTPLLTACLGCFSLQDLSSYSEGSAVTAELPSSGEPLAAADDAGASEIRAMENQDPANLPLAPAGTADTTDPAGTADDCAAAGEFSDPASSSCYLLSESAGSWRDGRDLCQIWGGDLAQLVSREETALASEHCDEDVWIGARDFEEEGNFRWLDGDELDPEDASWGAGQPDNYEGREDCVELRANDDNWNDASCGSDKPALCERPLAGDR